MFYSHEHESEASTKRDYTDRNAIGMDFPHNITFTESMAKVRVKGKVLHITCHEGTERSSSIAVIFI